MCDVYYARGVLLLGRAVVFYAGIGVGVYGVVGGCGSGGAAGVFGATGVGVGVGAGVGVGVLVFCVIWFCLVFVDVVTAVDVGKIVLPFVSRSWFGLGIPSTSKPLPPPLTPLFFTRWLIFQPGKGELKGNVF